MNTDVGQSDQAREKGAETNFDCFLLKGKRWFKQNDKLKGWEKQVTQQQINKALTLTLLQLREAKEHITYSYIMQSFWVLHLHKNGYDCQVQFFFW